MKINKQFILVRIDKEAQEKKKNKKGHIYISPKFAGMKYNLQYGEIIQIGSNAAKEYPSAAVGDTAFFKHSVEDQDWRLLYKEFNPKYPGDYSMADEFRVVDSTNPFELLAFMKPDLTFFTTNAYVFVDTNVKLLTHHLTSDLLFLSNKSSDAWQNDEFILEQIGKLEVDKKNIQETMETIKEPYALESMYSEYTKIVKQMETLTKFIHQEKLCFSKVEFISADNSKRLNIQPGEVIITDNKLLYPFDVFGNEFFLVPTEHLTGVFKLKN